MKVECPGCMSVYNIDDTKIPEAGARVKCPKCQNVLVVKKPPPRPAVLQGTGPNQEVISRNESAEINNDSTPQTKNCPYCGEEILAVATRCKHCGSDLAPGQSTGPKKDSGELFGILMLCCPVVAAMLIWFWVGSMNILQNPRSALTFITVATIIITAILAAVEASQLGFGSSSSDKKETGPIGFFFGILLLWVISYPYYLYQRRKKGKKNLLAGGIIVALVFMLSLLSMNVALSQAGFNFSMSSIGEYATRSKDSAAREAFDVGNKRLPFKDLSGSFVNSPKAGKLFVVKGWVTNKYPDRRSFIRIRSNILDSKRAVVSSKVVFAGHPLTDKELKSLSVEEIHKRLSDKLGKNKMNTNVLPNSSIPFVVIFNNLPEDMSEFTVEAVSSSLAKKWYVR